MFYLSHQCHKGVIIFSILNSILKFSRKKDSLSTSSFAWNLYRSRSGSGYGTTTDNVAQGKLFFTVCCCAGNLESLKQEEKRVGAIVARFGQDWRQSLDQINREILSSFPNLRLGTGILQQTLTTLVQYYHRYRLKRSLTRDF
jgi:hypothetical protein